MKIRALIFSLLAFLVTGAARAESYSFQEPVTRTGAFAASGKLTLENVNGNVEVRTWEKNEILVEVEKRAATDEELKLIELTIDLSEVDTAIKVRLPKRPGSTKGIRATVNFKVTVPASATLEKISAVNGSVALDGVRGPVNVSSVNGGVRATGLGGDAKLSTVNGGIKVDFNQVSAQQKLSFNTVNGQVSVRLPKEAGVELHGSVVNGIVSCDFPLESGKKSWRNLSGRIGDGRAALEARTVNGRVSIGQL